MLSEEMVDHQHVFITLPLYPDMSIANIVLHQKTDFEFYGRTLTVTGVVGSEGNIFILSSGELKVILNGKAFLSGNPFLTLVGQTVTIRVVIHGCDETYLWQVLYNSAYGIGE
jgi:hypothetical protein